MDFQLTEEQKLLKRTVREIAEREVRPRVYEWPDNNTTWYKLHRETMAMLARGGLLGITIPEEYGGGGAPTLDYVLVVEELGRVCYYTARIVQIVSGNLSQPIVHLGTEEQRQKYLPGLAKGEIIGSICMTEPGAGSDLSAIKTSARLNGDYYHINGQKVFNTHSDIADYYVVFARFSDRPGLSGLGIIMVDKRTPGVSFDKVKFNMYGDHEVTIFFDGCKVPRSSLLVPEGEFRSFLTDHNHQRCGSSASSLGIGQGAFDDALKYAKERVQFGRPIAEFQGIQWMLADMAVRLEAARLLLYRAAANVPLRLSTNALEASMAKAYVNDTCVSVTGDAVQIMGSYGLSKEYPMELRYRIAKATGIAGGTIQILKNTIAHQVIHRGVGIGQG